jgi:hypothetical protein
MRSVKPFVLFAALLALVGGAGLFATPAAGNTTSVTATASGTGTFIVIATYTNSPAGVPATLTANGTGAFTTAAAGGAAGVTVSGFTAGSKTVTTTPDSSGVATNTITIQATFTCQAAGQVTFVLTQTGGTPATSSSTPVTCTAGTTGTTGGLSVNPASAGPGQQVSVSGTCQAGAALTANPPGGQFVNATVNGQPAMPSAGGIQCTAAGTLTAVYMCAQQGQVTFTLGGATGTLSCGAQSAGASIYGQQQLPYGQQPYGQQPYGQPISQAGQGGSFVPNQANAGTSNSPVSIQMSPSNVACGTTGTVTVSARGPDGQTIQQGAVNLYTTSGAIEPKTGTITNGKFETKYIAPAIGGTATIGASVAGVSNSIDVKVDCAGGASAATTSSNSSANSLANRPASPPPPPPAGAPIISPPSTGDGGLLPDKD